MSESESPDSVYITLEGVCFTSDHFEKRQDDVCIEQIVHIHLNDNPIASLVATPVQLRELGAGFVISEGFCEYVDDVLVDSDIVKVYAPQTPGTKEYVTESSGGVSTINTTSRVRSSITIDQHDVFMMISQIVSELWEKTGGAHCSVLLANRELIAKSSDVGRHNTVDKVIGYGVLNKIDLSACVLGCTGRQPAGMISKAVNAGIPIVVSKAATTREGVVLADKAGLTLICRVKGNRFCVYTHPERVLGSES